MCGITGYYCFKSSDAPKLAVLKRMTDSMAHRGPDDAGYLQLGKVGLGHRRLSIIDLSKKGKQPLWDKEKRACISFNGEIYNFMDIKRPLEEKGYKFNSKTDTEVIVNAYLDEGISCLEKFNGMFAFALYDKEKDELYLARDRLGIKPLYYAMLDNGIVFGSEIKSILLFPGVKREPNLKAVSSYLSFRYVLGEETLFKGIKKLLPGHFLKIAGKRVEAKEYWRLNPRKNKRDKGAAYYRQKTEALLTKAVERRLVSDVPVGAFLSGGLDSSALVCLMSGLSKSKVKTFSIGFKEEGFNELPYAESVAKHCNTQHKEIVVSAENYFDTLKHLIKCKDLPLSVPNEVPLYLMSKELKKDITVVLSGEGADEIFMGYGRIFRSPFDFERLSVAQKLPLPLYRRFFRGLFEKYGKERFNSQLEHFLYNYSYFPLKEKKKIFNEKMDALVGEDEELTTQFEQIFDEAAGLPYYEKVSFVFEKMHLPGLLGRMDNSSMAASVEARVPFVDHELVEFMFSVPHKYKLVWNSLGSRIAALNKSSDEISEQLDTTKYILREIFRQRLPEEILVRKKQGFPVPLNQWFQKDFMDYAEEILLAKDAMIRAFIDQKKLRKWIGEKREKKPERFGQWLWMLINLEFWMQHYFGGRKK